MRPPETYEDPSCNFHTCLGRWRSCCSPRVPTVAPGRDYEFIPAGADESLSWSLLVGFISSSAGSSSLSLHRFCVARSGRVLGRSCDDLEILGDVVCESKVPSLISGVTATPSPEGRSICLFSREISLVPHDSIAPPRPLQLQLDANSPVTVSPLPDLPPELGSFMATRPISACGNLWAPYLESSLLVMLLLDKDNGKWRKVSTINLPQGKEVPKMRSGRILQGYAVVGHTILLSLLPSHLFFTFNCSNTVWAAVDTTETKNTHRYVPIHERGVYVEEDDTIYFLRSSFVYAYKLCIRQNQGHFWMAPPTMVDCVCPASDEGYGFLTHLSNGVMCSTWISASLCCSCDTSHVLITTFRVKGSNGKNREPFVPKGIEVLYSTCRKLNMFPRKPSESTCEFCFLQAYEEFDYGSAIVPHINKSQHTMAPSTIYDMRLSSEMRTCCRKLFSKMQNSTSIMLDVSAIQINKSLIIVCQTASHSTVYKITIMDGRLMCHHNTLRPHCIMAATNMPFQSHFICDSQYIFSAPRKENVLYRCNLDSGTLRCSSMEETVNVSSISIVLLVGSRIIAIGDTMEFVYHLCGRVKRRWIQCVTHGCVDLPLNRSINLSGYVVLSENSVMVSDADSSCCFLLDLKRNEWRAVMTSYWCQRGVLTGRSVCVNGFIYTCSDEGLNAYELIEQGDSYLLGDQIELRVSCPRFRGSDRMCFDYVSKDTDSGAIMFSLVQGGEYNRRHGSSRNHPICISTVQVKTEQIIAGKLKPVAVGHVDICTCYVEGDGKNIWASNCFVRIEEGRGGPQMFQKGSTSGFA